MSKRTRVFIGILLAYALGAGALLYRQLGDIDPRYRESAEESLVETAQLLATLIEQDSSDGALRSEALPALFQQLYARRFKADIYGFEKTRVELRVTVVDREGQVVFDSMQRELGDDHSGWRDIKLALRSEYGARTTPDIEGDARSSVMYVAAPIRIDDRIIGAVSAAKPVQSFGQFVDAARRKTLLVGATSVAAVLLLMLILSVWLVRPFGLIADYVAYVRAQRSFNLPRLGRRALGALGAAYDEMRDALAGRSYVADYVQTLTHEVKSPLSAIRGAAELLREPMPTADHARFVANIEREAQRIQQLVDRMMELIALESRPRLDSVAPVPLRALLLDVATAMQVTTVARSQQIRLEEAAHASVSGDAFLLHRAVTNLVANALDFSPDGGTVTLALQVRRNSVELTVRDQGPGVPDYAEHKVFEKFYSLARPHSHKKSTGLGLAFVKEIAALHQGRATLKNHVDGGALATLSLPLAEGHPADRPGAAPG